jgi:hypothetical protein
MGWPIGDPVRTKLVSCLAVAQPAPMSESMSWPGLAAPLRKLLFELSPVFPSVAVKTLP